MKREFIVYKKGRTPKKGITILSKEGEPFDREFKINKYLFLGYTVTEL